MTQTPHHRSHMAHNCGPCRSERIAADQSTLERP